MKFNNLKDIVVTNKVVFVRCDFNVPIAEDGSIADDTRIIEAMPTINYLSKNHAKVVIATHFGRPNGKVNPNYSTKIIAEYLNNIVRNKIYFVDDCIGDKVKNALKKMDYGDILILENLRFYKEEESCDLDFVKQLSEGMNIYVNEAFSCSHRLHASIFGVPMMIKASAGFRFQTEIDFLSKILQHLPTPAVGILGGSKISTKISILKQLSTKLNFIIPAGGILNNFLKFKKFNIGKSIYEQNKDDIIKEIMEIAEKNNCKIILPERVIVAKSHDDPNYVSKKVSEIEQDDMILDMDHNFIKNEIQGILIKSKLCIMNGPLGLFEIKPFDKGTSMLSEIIIKLTKDNKLISIAGGGDTIAAIAKNNNPENFSFISTAGGAFLEFMEGKTLPGLEVLEKFHDKNFSE